MTINERTKRKIQELKDQGKNDDEILQWAMQYVSTEPLTDGDIKWAHQVIREMDDSTKARLKLTNFEE